MEFYKLFLHRHIYAAPVLVRCMMRTQIVRCLQHYFRIKNDVHIMNDSAGPTNGLILIHDAKTKTRQTGKENYGLRIIL